MIKGIEMDQVNRKVTPKEFNMNNHPMKRSDWGRKKGKL
jgi:hypothetical protein